MPSILKLASTTTLLLAVLISSTAADICSTLSSKGIPIKVKSSAQYTSSLDYWSSANDELNPTCIVTPFTSQQISDVITSLQNVGDLFAVKSGGHSANEGFSSIQNGLLISTQKLTSVTCDHNTQTAVIGPGLSWEQAQLRLNSTGQMIVGGRVGGVGVGGLLLGGGLSFLSSQYGWAANNVLNYEVVLANGTIVNANSTENNDLFMALKGGGNNFGIVTAYTVQTYAPKDQKVWGGWIWFSPNVSSLMLEAVGNFTENYPDDKAAIIPTYNTFLNNWALIVFFDGPTPPHGVFDNFTSIPTADPNTKTWDSYYALLQNNDFFNNGNNDPDLTYRNVVGAETMPLPNQTVGSEVMQSIYNYWYNSTNNTFNYDQACESFGTIAFQPMPRTIAQKAKAKGGDLLNFPTDHDYILIHLVYSWKFAGCDQQYNAAMQGVYHGIDNMTTGYIQQGILPNVSRPLFMNDAYHLQDYWGRLNTKKKALRTRLRYDPQGFFQNRTNGGFRLS